MPGLDKLQKRLEAIPKAVREAKQGRVEFRTDRSALVHVPIGKVGFEERALLENLSALIEAIQREKPAGAKGQYVEKISVSSTMGPGIKLDTQEINARHK